MCLQYVMLVIPMIVSFPFRSMVFPDQFNRKKVYPLLPILSALLWIVVMLLHRVHFFTVYMDNYISNIRLFARQLDYGISACETVWSSSKDFPNFLNISMNKAIGSLEWNLATAVVVQEVRALRIKDTVKQTCQLGILLVMAFLWQENSIDNVTAFREDGGNR